MNVIEWIPIGLALFLAFGGTRMRYLHRGELPGLLPIVLAGRQHRAQLRAILDRRAAGEAGDEKAPGA